MPSSSKTAVVIGASSGMGRSLAGLLVKGQYHVVITGRRCELLEEIKQENPEKYITACFDINDREAVKENFSFIINQLQHVDLFVISAGFGDPNPQLDPELEQEIVQTNVMAFTFLADLIFNFFQQQRYGQLAAITSVAGLRGNRQAPAYFASKAYQQKYLEGLRQKANKLKLPIAVTDIRPGFVNTKPVATKNKLLLVPVDKAARQIYAAIKARKHKAYISRRWAVAGSLLKLVPGWLYEKL